MEISLNEFEHQIDETILKRGLQYFKKGHVTDVEELGGGEYEAIVEGSEDYIVDIIMKGDVVKDYNCSCPYDMGPVCKHVVAVLFYLQKDKVDVINIPVIKRKTTKEKTQPKKKTITEQVNDILNALPEEEFKDFIRLTCKNDREFRYRFFAKFAYVGSPVSKELYTSQIRNLIEAYSDRYGLIGYHEASEFGKAISDMLDNAEGDVESGKPEKALPIILAVIEEIPPVLNSSDDSNGYIGGCMEFALELLNRLTGVEIEESFRKELFNKLIVTHEGGKLNGWGWDFDLIEFAIRLLKISEEKECVKTILNKIKPTDKDWNWDFEKAQHLMLGLIQKTENADAATQYLKDNVSNAKFREELIKRAIEAKEYEQALHLASDGLTNDNKRFSGLANQWREYMLAIYQKQEDTENVIRMSYYFVMNETSYSHSLKYYYNILKKTIPADSWSEYLEKIIAEIFKKADWYDYDKLFQFYVWESYLDRLLTLLQKNTSLTRIEDAEKYLATLYPQELASLYQKAILTFVEQNLGRPHYKQACKYIRRMKKLGGSQMANNLIENLKSLYKNRRALLEELAKV